MRLYSSRAARLAAERRGRRGVRAGLVAVSLTGLAAGIGLAALPAGATTTPVPLRAVGGDGQVTAAWSAVRGAAGYTVHYGKGTSTARTVTTSSTSVRLTGLTNRTTYSVRVTANGAAGATNRVTAKPVPYVPTSITSVKATPAGPNQIKVSWSGGGQARSFAIIAGADSMTKINHFSTGWHPAAIHSWILTVPPRLRGVLGAGTGNVVFLKVVQTNSTASNPVKHLTFNLADRYRLTPSGTWSLTGNAAVAEPAVAPDHVSVASLNVQSIGASKTMSLTNQWEQRLPRVVNTIEASHPDLLGTQELDTVRTDSGCLVHTVAGVRQYCEEQYNTLQKALASSALATQYRIADTKAAQVIYDAQHAGQAGTIDSHLFFNPTKLAVVKAGYFSPIHDLHVAWDSAVVGGDRMGAWAVFAILDANGNRTGREFLAATVHLPQGESSTVANIRKAEATALGVYLDGKAATADGKKLPIVLVGDFNAYGAWDAKAGSLALYRQGYFDTAATTNRNRTHMRFSTSNATNGTGGADLGYPTTVVMHPYPTSRIDYILVKGSPFTYRYDNVVHVASGRFVKSLQGSDHNLQYAEVGITDPR